MTDAGLKELAASSSFTTLNLGYTKVTDAGLKELTDLKAAHGRWSLRTRR